MIDRISSIAGANMFDTLVESRPTRVRRVGGSMASVVLHAGVVVALVAATARGAIERIAETHAERVIFTPPAVPVTRSAVEQPRTTRVAEPAAPAAPDAPAVPPIIAPIEIPSIIAPPIPSRGVATDLRAEDVRRQGGIAGGVPGGRGNGIGDPNGVFSENTVDRPVVLVPGSRGPAFPEALRSAGIEGGVMAQFVVDTTGRVEEGSLRMLQADHPAFADAVRRALPSMRFLPAEAGGHRVRQLVQLPFRFDLSRFELD